MSSLRSTLSFALRCATSQSRVFSVARVSFPNYLRMSSSSSAVRLSTQSTHAMFSSSSSESDTNAMIIDEVESKVFKVLRSASKCNTDKLARTATFEELGFDSLDGVELVVAMEETFGFDITNEEAERITTVQEAITVFSKNLTEKINRDKLSESDASAKNWRRRLRRRWRLTHWRSKLEDAPASQQSQPNPLALSSACLLETSSISLMRASKQISSFEGCARDRSNKQQQQQQHHNQPRLFQ